jgi:hypothetical protein
MTHYSSRELKKLKKDAEEFGRHAKPGVTYYYIDRGRPKPLDSNGRRHELLAEVVFERPSRSSKLLGGDVPRWYGPHTAVDAYVKLGPLYEDRSHRDIRGKITAREWEQAANARGAEFLESDELQAAVDAAATGTRFKTTSPSRKFREPKKEKVAASR